MKPIDSRAWPDWGGKKYHEVVEELVRKHVLAVENLTEMQLVEAIRQAIACGDFQRHVCPSNSSQVVIYIPHAREMYLLNKVRELEEQQAVLQVRIKALVQQVRLAKSLCTICGEYLPGHATGGADICTCQ